MTISRGFYAVALAGLALGLPAAIVDARARSPAEARLLISSAFGERVDPFTGQLTMHRGIDLPAPMGTDVFAAAAGRVVFSGWSHGYGNLIELAHADGSRTRYGHLSRILVQPGDTVTQGQSIARMGSTGRSTGSHLHFEYWAQGHPIDPRPYIGTGAMPLLRPSSVELPGMDYATQTHRSAFAAARERAGADPMTGLPNGDRVGAREAR
jgi:murein DD-endopeptidase MepM/ murein hydrolase activator NlpD